MKRSAFQPVLRKRGELTLLERLPVPPNRRQVIPCARGTGDTGLRLRRREIGAGLAEAGTGLAGAWQRLGSATFSARSLADLLWVLEATVCVSPAVAPVPDFRCGPRDVRGCLDDPASVRALMTALARYQPEALRLLRRDGRDLRIRDENSYFQEALSGTGVTPRVAGGVLPWLRGSQVTSAVLAAWQELSLGAEPDREALLTILLECGGADWLPVVAQQPVADRIAILRLLTESPAGAQSPPQGICGLFLTLEHLPGINSWIRRLPWVLGGLAEGASPGWLSACLRWHVRHRKDLPEVRGGAVRPARRALHLVIRRGCACLRRDPEKVWRLLSGDPAAEPALRRIFAEGSRLPRWQQDLSCVLAGTRRGGWKRDQFLRLLPELLTVATDMRGASRYDCWNLLDEWIVRSTAACARPDGELLHWLRRFAAGGPALPYKGLRFLALCLAVLDSGRWSAPERLDGG